MHGVAVLQRPDQRLEEDGDGPVAPDRAVRLRVEGPDGAGGGEGGALHRYLAADLRQVQRGRAHQHQVRVPGAQRLAGQVHRDQGAGTGRGHGERGPGQTEAEGRPRGEEVRVGADLDLLGGHPVVRSGLRRQVLRQIAVQRVQAVAGAAVHPDPYGAACPAPAPGPPAYGAAALAPGPLPYGAALPYRVRPAAPARVPGVLQGVEAALQEQPVLRIGEFGLPPAHPEEAGVEPVHLRQGRARPGEPGPLVPLRGHPRRREPGPGEPAHPADPRPDVAPVRLRGVSPR